MKLSRSRGATALALLSVLGMTAACGLPRSGPNKAEIYKGSVLKQGDAFVVTVNSRVTRATAVVDMMLQAEDPYDALTAGTADEAQAKEILDIDMDGEDITVAFNPTYLIEGLSAIAEPFVRMKMTTAVKPVEFNGQQESDSEESMDYRYLLVPMRFNS